MKTISAILAPLLLAIPSCGGDEPAPEPQGLPEHFLLREAPAEPLSVKEAREQAGEGERIAVTGRVQDLAARHAQLVLYDASLTPCNEREDDACPTPWDYCCESLEDIKAARATIEFRDGGRPLAARLAGWHDLGRLVTVTVTGTAHLDDAQNLVVEADGIHIRR